MSEPVGKAGRPTSRRAMWIILGGWIVMLAIVAGGMFVVRERTLATMSTPEAQAEWDAWRESEVNQRDDLPVKRRPPKSIEPPALVLMRDHFPMLLGAAVVFGSLLYGALAFAVRGSFQAGREIEPQRTRRNTEERGEG